MHRSALVTFALGAALLMLAPTALASVTMSQRYELPTRHRLWGEPLSGAASGGHSPLLFYAPFATASITVTLVDDTLADTAFDVCVKTGTATTTCGIGAHDDTLVEHAVNSVTIDLASPLPTGGRVEVFPLLLSASSSGEAVAGLSGTAHVTFH